MDMNAINKVELFLSNYATIESGITWRLANFKRLSALLYSFKNRVINSDKIITMTKLIKSKTNSFSYFRSRSNLSLATMLSLEDNPEEVLDKSLKVYGLLKKGKIRRNEFLPITALFIASNKEEYEYSTIIKKMKSLEEGINKLVPSYFKYEDYLVILSIATSEMNTDYFLKKFGSYVELLKKNFSNKKALADVSAMLTLVDNQTELDKKIIKLIGIFKDNQIKIKHFSSLSIFALLTLFDLSVDEIYKRITDIYDMLLATRKRLGIFVAKEELIKYSSYLTASLLLEENQITLLIDNPKELLDLIAILEVSHYVAVYVSNASY